MEDHISITQNGSSQPNEQRIVLLRKKNDKYAHECQNKELLTNLSKTAKQDKNICEFYDDDVICLILRLFIGTLPLATFWLENEKLVKLLTLEWPGTCTRKTSTKRKQRFLLRVTFVAEYFRDVLRLPLWEGA